MELDNREIPVTDDDVHPINYANDCPHVALTRLHFYFPWSITAP